jgi:Acetyltransferase (GNAT) domain
MIYLRELAQADMAILNRWRHDRAVVDWLGANYLYIDAEIDAAWYQNYLKTRHQHVRLAIVATGGVATGDLAQADSGLAEPEPAAATVAQPGVAQPGVAQPGVAQPDVAQPDVAQPGVTQLGDRLIGTAYLNQIHPINRSAEFAIAIWDSAFWGQGAGEWASREVLRHGFLDLNLHRIYLYALAYNTRALHLYEKLGFRREGRLEAAIYKNGEYHDLVVMGYLRDRYPVQADRSSQSHLPKLRNSAIP